MSHPPKYAIDIVAQNDGTYAYRPERGDLCSRIFTRTTPHRTTLQRRHHREMVRDAWLDSQTMQTLAREVLQDGPRKKAAREEFEGRVGAFYAQMLLWAHKDGVPDSKALRYARACLGPRSRRLQLAAAGKYASLDTTPEQAQSVHRASYARHTGSGVGASTQQRSGTSRRHVRKA